MFVVTRVLACLACQLSLNDKATLACCCSLPSNLRVHFFILPSNTFLSSLPSRYELRRIKARRVEGEPDTSDSDSDSESECPQLVSAANARGKTKTKPRRK